MKNYAATDSSQNLQSDFRKALREPTCSQKWTSMYPALHFHHTRALRGNHTQPIAWQMLLPRSHVAMLGRCTSPTQTFVYEKGMVWCRGVFLYGFAPSGRAKGKLHSININQFLTKSKRHIFPKTMRHEQISARCVYLRFAGFNPLLPATRSCNHPC